jgi:hypothetical protein
MVVVVNFVVDVLYAVIDPRVKPGRYLSHELADLAIPALPPPPPPGRRLGVQATRGRLAAGPSATQLCAGRPADDALLGMAASLFVWTPGRPTRWTWPQAAGQQRRHWLGTALWRDILSLLWWVRATPFWWA